MEVEIIYLTKRTTYLEAKEQRSFCVARTWCVYGGGRLDLQVPSECETGGRWQGPGRGPTPHILLCFLPAFR